MKLLQPSKVGFLAFLVVIAPGITFAGQATITHTFQSGSPARAADMNQNFSDVKSAIDDNDSRVTANTSATNANGATITSHTTSISNNQSGISANASNISSNASGVAANAGNISANSSSISTNASGVSSNASNISGNTSDIAQNVANISSNASRVTGNENDIATNTAAISAIGTGGTNIYANGVKIGILVDAAETFVRALGLNGYFFRVNFDGSIYNTTIYYDGAACSGNKYYSPGLSFFSNYGAVYKDASDGSINYVPKNSSDSVATIVSRYSNGTCSNSTTPSTPYKLFVVNDEAVTGIPDAGFTLPITIGQ